jgi:tetrapyrrole methylase family protein/MazG family protein
MQKCIEAFEALIVVLKRLRAPEGCPWDRKQTEQTMAPLLLEEAYEAVDAIGSGQDEKMAEELGDLSMNLLMICLIAEERGAFGVEDVFRKITTKLIHRHPHVFKETRRIRVDHVLKQWEELKREERQEQHEDTSAVAGIPGAMPTLLRSIRLVEKIKRTGAALDFLENSGEKVTGLLEAVLTGKEEAGDDADAGAAGELLLAVVLMCLDRKINPEMALRSHLRSLEQAFRALEVALGDRLGNATREEVERIWNSR